jgi:4-hydroxy-3-methylbut-2-enyl diphosphate reductase
VIFSAHGVSKAVQDEASDRGLQVFDATCPLVTKVHVEVTAFSRAGRECILIGHEGHPEVEGTMGQYDTSKGGEMYLVEDEEQAANLAVRDPDNLAFVTQTTLSVDDTAKVIEALRARFPNIQGPRKDDICYATQNRQDAVRTLAEKSNVVLVVGSPNSSNSNRLKELAERCGASAYLIESADMIDPKWMRSDDKVGVTAGASAPEHLVEGVVSWLRSRGHEGVESLEGRPENITFSLPKELRIPMVDLS